MRWWQIPVAEVRRAGMARFRGRYLGAFLDRRFV